jgi:hypothetical protein
LICPEAAKNAARLSRDLYERRWRDTKLIPRRNLAVFAEISELTSVAPLILHIEGDAGIYRARIDVNADGALRIFAEIVETMNRLQFIRSHYRASGAGLDFADDFEVGVVGAGQTINSDDVLIFGMIAAEPFVINDGQIAALSDHPTELSVVRMDGGALSGLPANGHHLEQIVAVDQVARVKLVVEEDVWRERRVGDPHTRTEIEHSVARDEALLE